MSTDGWRQYACRTQDRINRYEFALRSFVALEHMFCTIKGASIYQGKKLHLADAGPDQGRVTPDMVVEVASSGSWYRAVIEIKESLPARPEDWGGVIGQLEKYVRATDGWSGAATGVPHDVMLAAGKAHAERFAAQARGVRPGSCIEEWLVVIRIASITYGNEDWVEIVKVCGKINHPRIDRETRQGKGYRIPMFEILKKMGRMKFYDSNPPVEYTMSILWDHVFSKFVHAKKLQKLKDGKKVALSVSMEQIREGVRAFAPRTNPECVRQSWINDAMSMFERISVVSRGIDGSFIISYRRHKMPTSDWIIGCTATLQNGGGSQRTPPSDRHAGGRAARRRLQGGAA